jgi:hypothetical protein
MPLPSFNEDGDLPLGIHQATLSEILDRFGAGTARRKVLGRRLERIYHLAHGTGHLARFVIFGSFITAKLEPNDVDVFLLMEDTFDITQLTGESRLVFEHAAAQDYFGCSVFWLRRLAVLGDERSAISRWQIKRNGTRRGVVEIISE